MDNDIDPARLYEMCLAHIASAILTCQTLESSLRSCVDHWFPQDSGMNSDQIDVEKARFEKATLSRLKKKFATYRPLPKSLDDNLESVLLRRNKLVHNFFEDVANSDVEGKWQIIAYCIELTLDARFCRRVVDGYMLDAQIIAFERTSKVLSPLQGASKYYLGKLRCKRSGRYGHETERGAGLGS